MTEYIKKTLHNFHQVIWLTTLLIGHDGFIAGGCFKDVLMGKKPKDVDIFFNHAKDYEVALKHFRDECKEGKIWSESYKSKKVQAFYNKKLDVTVELISSYYADPDDTLASFDFTITKMALYGVDPDSIDGQPTIHNKFNLLYHETFFEDLFMKRLVIDDELEFPVSSFKRSYKYQKYGYTMCRESNVKMLKAIRELTEINDEELGASLYFGKD